MTWKKSGTTGHRNLHCLFPQFLTSEHCVIPQVGGRLASCCWHLSQRWGTPRWSHRSLTKGGKLELMEDSSPPPSLRCILRDLQSNEKPIWNCSAKMRKPKNFLPEVWLNQPTNPDLQRGDECWEFSSEETQGRISGDEKNIIFIDAFEEERVEMLCPFPPWSFRRLALLALHYSLVAVINHNLEFLKTGHSSSLPHTLGCGDVGACSYVFLEFSLWRRGGRVCLSSMWDVERAFGSIYPGSGWETAFTLPS